MKERVVYSVETKQFKSFISLISEIDLKDRAQRDRGTLFELLVKAYFTKEPMYARLFDKVWMLNDVPDEYRIPKRDTGVDLVARLRDTGKLVAIQCKYYNKDKTIQKADIDSFLNEVGKRYYTEGIVISTTDKWSVNATEALVQRSKPIARIGLSELMESKIDWSAYSLEQPEEVRLQMKKTPRSHQKPAIEAVIQGFEKANRGKLIMAPGTGKTYTSMAIVEELAKKKRDTFKVLYLVPSIQLLSQSLRAWTGDINFEMDTVAVCSDRKVTKKFNGENEFEDITVADLGYPATTNYEKLLDYQKAIESKELKGDILTVFSTYQSIDVVIEAQKNGFYDFDLVICDEAHRTTGATESGKESSAFVKVHSDNNIKTSKRLYQTATPRIYGDKAKQKADEMSVLIADMNDENLYGKEFYRIGFGDAVRNGILTDYKVMVLAVDEAMIQKRFQQMFSSQNNELEFDDVTKIIGCWNGLIKRKNNSDELEGKPMKRAIAFTGTIRESKLITNMFSQVVDQYINESGDQTESFKVEIDHADGSMNALQKNEKINWLKSEVPDQTCRILSNARFLTEGVDVPDLDAIMFLKPRKSKIDIAQAVGRVMRKVPGKDYGYVILPIGVPAGVDESTVLDNNEKYRVVWEVLNALRSIDERFDATINKLEMNKKKPNQIQVIGVGEAPEEGYDGFTVQEETEQLRLFSEDDWSDLEKAIYGKIVKKVGNVRYWEDWSKDVAKIAQQHITRITAIVEDKKSIAYYEFSKFLNGLRHNINKSITVSEAMEMLAQHMITKPVFDALFEHESFVMNNPVSRAMDGMISVLESLGLTKEQEKLEGFYDSVRVRAKGIDNLQAKQDIIVQLYDKFFRVGFPSTTEKLGIVFTPTEAVDFIVHSVNDVLKIHFDKSLSEEGVNILDPFTGTGTFITRLLQSGLISKEDMIRKYTQELHANEIVLLSYYIAAINIEETYNTLMKSEKYLPFKGIVLTDTFESTEQEDTLDDEFFGVNDHRIKKQRALPITVVIGNPPYSVGAKDENASEKNIVYPKLDRRISETYAKESSSKSLRSLYDTYIKAYRWASDRINEKGVIGFVTNASFIDSQSTDGLRKCWYEEFNYIYVFNLRGDARTQGERRKKEAGNIFGSGSRTPIAIVLLVKDGSKNHQIKYKDIGDYHSTDDKLQIIRQYKSITGIDWADIKPDKNKDWINQRNDKYEAFPEMLGGYYNTKVDGIQTNRDDWVYSYSKHDVVENAEKMIDNYNYELNRLANSQNRINEINTNPAFISWSRALKKKISIGKNIEKKQNAVLVSMYRPFTKKYVYYNPEIIEYPRNFNEILKEKNIFISVTGAGTTRGFSALINKYLPNYHLMDTGRNFYLYDYSDSLFEGENYNISEDILTKLNISPEDVIYYIYGIFHSKHYKESYFNDLVKELPRIPVVANKEPFITVGKKIADLHLNYEDVPPCPDVIVSYKNDKPSYAVKKMKYLKKDRKDTIVVNKDITITNIPEKAYEYVVNGKPAIDWILDQYQVKVKRGSGIVDDPNKYSGDSKYILNLLLSIINMSIQTVNLADTLPELEIIE